MFAPWASPAFASAFTFGFCLVGNVRRVTLALFSFAGIITLAFIAAFRVALAAAASTPAGPTLPGPTLSSAALSSAALPGAAVAFAPAFALGRGIGDGVFNDALLSPAVCRCDPLGRYRDQHIGIESSHRDLLFDEGFDIGQTHRVLITRETDSVARFAETCGTADAMHVIFGIEWQVVVEHVAYVGNVQAARGDVGRDEYAEVAGDETGEEFLALFLRHIAR